MDPSGFQALALVLAGIIFLAVMIAFWIEGPRK